MIDVRKNILVFILVVIIAVTAAIKAFDYISSSDALSVVAKLWALDLALLSATFALMYKLYDSAYVKGLSKKKQQRVRILVIDKTRRLWVLIAMIALLIILSALPQAWLPQDLKMGHARLTVGLFVGDVLLFFGFVPAMWSELRDFQSSQKALEDDAVERDAYLAHWASEDK